MAATDERSTQSIVADRGDAGERIDQVICRRLAHVSGASRTRVQAWIDAGRVVRNGERVTRGSTRAAAGDTLVVDVPVDALRRVMEPERADALLRVLYEDEHLLALDKPAGAVVHPAYRNPTGTIMNALLWYARDWPAGTMPALVGRLDKDTTGVLLVSKSGAVHAALQRATAASVSSKEYLAVVYGRVRTMHGTIDDPLGVDPADRRRTAVDRENGAPSTTRFERLGQVDAPESGLALMRCTLGSGRRHQIRVHLSARGWPIVGDATYGDEGWRRIADPQLSAALRAFPRQALHAARLRFCHPLTGAALIIDAPVPGDMLELLARTGLSGALAAPELR